MTSEAHVAGLTSCRPTGHPFPPGGRLGDGRPGLNSSPRGPRMEPCLIAPGSFRAVRENARARRARGAISELGGPLAERRDTRVR